MLTLVFNPLTGNLDYVASPIFNLYYVASGVTVIIPDGSENICTALFTSDGVTQVDGKVTVLL